MNSLLSQFLALILLSTKYYCLCL